LRFREDNIPIVQPTFSLMTDANKNGGLRAAEKYGRKSTLAQVSVLNGIRKSVLTIKTFARTRFVFFFIYSFSK